jgi:outer membrane murein-binding lipoprotein Lpp
MSDMAGDLPNWALGVGAAAVAGVSGFVVGLVNRGPAMQQAISSAIEPLLNGYRARVEELVTEVQALRSEVTTLHVSLATTKGELEATKGGIMASSVRQGTL